MTNKKYIRDTLNEKELKETTMEEWHIVLPDIKKKDLVKYNGKITVVVIVKRK